MRATQFYSLVDTVLGMLIRLPIVPLPGDFRFQPCDPRDVAAWLGQAVAAGPGAAARLCRPHRLHAGANWRKRGWQRAGCDGGSSRCICLGARLPRCGRAS